VVFHQYSQEKIKLSFVGGLMRRLYHERSHYDKK